MNKLVIEQYAHTSREDEPTDNPPININTWNVTSSQVGDAIDEVNNLGIDEIDFDTFDLECGADGAYYAENDQGVFRLTVVINS